MIAWRLVGGRLCLMMARLCQIVIVIDNGCLIVSDNCGLIVLDVSLCSQLMEEQYVARIEYLEAEIRLVSAPGPCLPLSLLSTLSSQPFPLNPLLSTLFPAWQRYAS